MFDRKTKPSISYITRDGKEENLGVNVFNRGKIEKLLKVVDRCQYLIDEDVELIHLKNFIFDDNVYFGGDVDTVIILENCIFKSNKLRFFLGDVEVINPVIMSSRVFDIDANDVGDFRVIFTDDNSDCARIPIHYDVKAKNIEISGGNPDLWNVKADNIYLGNIKKMYFGLHLDNIKRIFIDNCNIGGSVYIDALEDINLKDSFIDGFDSFLFSPVVNVDNILFNSDGVVKFGKECYYPIDNGCVFLNDNDFREDGILCNRKNLISVLKGYRDLVYAEVEKGKQEVSNYFSREKEECKIRSEELEIRDERVTRKLEKKLLNRPCSSFVKKGNNNSLLRNVN